MLCGKPSIGLNYNKLEIFFFIPGQPVAKGRPRFARRGNYVQTYTPAKTLSYERLVAYSASQAMKSRNPSLNAVSLKMTMNLSIPSSWSEKRKQLARNGELFPLTKPDIDNCVKCINDGMNGIVFKDDSQIVDVIVKKRYSDIPGVYIEVSEMSV